MKGSFHYSFVPASGLELKAHVHIKLSWDDLFVTLEPLRIMRSGRWGKNWIMLQKRYASVFALYDIVNMDDMETL